MRIIMLPSDFVTAERGWPLKAPKVMKMNENLSCKVKIFEI